MTSSIQSRLGTAPEEGCKAPVKTVANSPITLSGAQTINTIDLVAGDRVLVNGQADASENGIFNVQNTAWTYAKDWNKSNDVISGMLVPVSDTVEIYQLSNFTGSFVAGTTEVTFTLTGNVSVALQDAVDAAVAEAIALAGTGFVVQSLETQTGFSSGQTVVTLSTMSYIVGTNNLTVVRNGLTMTSGLDFTEDSTTQVTVTPALESTDRMIFRTNDTTTNTVSDSSGVSHTSGGSTTTLAAYLDEQKTNLETQAVSTGITHDNGDAVVTVKSHLDTEAARIDDLETTTSALSDSSANAWTTVNLGLVGVVSAFAGSAAPTGWLLCTGNTISRTTYSVLFAVIGTTYGAGDGVTTFRLPDLRAEFIRGLDASRGVDAGRVLGTSQADELESHSHFLGYTAGTSRGSPDNPVGAVYDNTDNTIVSGSTGGTETRPRNVAMNYIIKI
jgi:microcystin-dependent protein